MCFTVLCEAVCCAGTQICNLACCCCKYSIYTKIFEFKGYKNIYDKNIKQKIIVSLSELNFNNDHIWGRYNKHIPLYFIYLLLNNCLQKAILLNCFVKKLYFAETTLKEQIKLAYILLNYSIMALTVIALYYIQDFYINYLKYFGCPEGIQNLCLGISGIYRMSFVLTIFYIIILLFMFEKGWLAKMINNGLWLLKFIFIAVLFYGTLYMSNKFFEVFVQISIVASGIYLLFQIIIYIDIFYLWAEKWARMYDEGIEGMGSALVAASSLTYILALILNIYNFIWFDHNYFINLINIAIIILLQYILINNYKILNIIYNLINQIHKRLNNQLQQQYNYLDLILMDLYLQLVVSLVIQLIKLSVHYLAIQMLIHLQQSQFFKQIQDSKNYNYFYCINIFYDSEQNMKIQMYVNGILNFIALSYIIFATQEQSKQALIILDKSSEKKRSNQNSNQQIEIEMTSTQQMNEAKALIEQIELQPYSTNQYIVFHIVMSFCSMYMAMMITNWGSPSIRVDTFEIYMPSQLSYNVKIGSSWICSGLYFWTLIAPRILPNRFN